MNIHNISKLSLQLKQIGFDNMDYRLMKRICLAPDNFILIEKFSKMSHLVSFQFYFERTAGNDFYDLIYYDASLHQENSFTNTDIEGINIQQLDEQMNKVDWITVFNFSKMKSINLEDKSSFETELNIHQILCGLHKLEKTETGKIISISLKQKYWSETPCIELMGPISNVKNKFEVNQRFYFSDGQAIISADEAYRFLLNRWTEKQILSKKKQQDTPEETATNESDDASGNGLLRKRRIGNNKRNKSTKS